MQVRHIFIAEQRVFVPGEVLHGTVTSGPVNVGYKDYAYPVLLDNGIATYFRDYELQPADENAPPAPRCYSNGAGVVLAVHDGGRA